MAHLGLSRAVTATSNPVQKLSQRYLEVSWAERLIALISLTALVAVLAWRLEYNPLYGAGGALGAGILLHVLLTHFGWAALIITWFANIVSIPITAQAYTTHETNPSDFVFFYATSVAGLLISSIIWTIVAARIAPGKLWITLAMVFLFQNFLGGAFAILVNTNLAIFFAVAMGGLAIALRIFLNRKKVFGSLVRLDRNDANKIINRLSKTQLKPIVTLNSMKDASLAALAITESPRGLEVIYGFKTSSPLNLKNGRLRHEGKYLEDFLAPLIVETLGIAQVAKLPDAHTIVLVKDRLLAKGALKVNLSTQQGTKVGTAVVAHPDYLNEALATLPKLKGNPKAREILRNKYARKSTDESDAQ